MYEKKAIYISGPDGSGKTTLAKLMYMYLSKHGSVRVHWVRGSHLAASLLLRFMSRFSVFRGYCNPYYQVCIPVKLRPLWIHIEFWSFIPYIILRNIFYRLYRYIIGDRCELDFIIWIILTLGYPSIITCVYGRFLLGLSLKKLTIYTYADIDTLTKRTGMPREFLVKEYVVYEILSKYYTRVKVNTGICKPIECFKQTKYILT